MRFAPIASHASKYTHDEHATEAIVLVTDEPHVEVHGASAARAHAGLEGVGLREERVLLGEDRVARSLPVVHEHDLNLRL